MEVKDTIRKLRELNHLTQEYMAEKLDISVNGYSKIERGLTKLSAEKLEQIADIFHINVSELYSAKEKGFICLFSEGNQSNSTIYTHSDTTVFENEKLKLELKHKEEIIAKLESENALLKDMLSFIRKVDENKCYA